MPSIHLTALGTWFLAMPLFGLAVLFGVGSIALADKDPRDSLFGAFCSLLSLLCSGLGLHLIGYPLFN